LYPVDFCLRSSPNRQHNVLSNVSLEGAGLASQWREIAILAAWAAGSFLVALRWFRWN
jgi:hypothetical protein